MARILLVSSDESLLRTRQMLLEEKGHEVVSALGFVSSLEHCRAGGFDLFILGHSLSHSQKKRLVETFKRFCPAPIISLRRRPAYDDGCGADYYSDPEPDALLQLVDRIVGGLAAGK